MKETKLPSQYFIVKIKDVPNKINLIDRVNNFLMHEINQHAINSHALEFTSINNVSIKTLGMLLLYKIKINIKAFFIERMPYNGID